MDRSTIPKEAMLGKPPRYFLHTSKQSENPLPVVNTQDCRNCSERMYHCQGRLYLVQRESRLSPPVGVDCGAAWDWGGAIQGVIALSSSQVYNPAMVVP